MYTLPFARLPPPLAAEEEADLEADIRRNGILTEVVTTVGFHVDCGGYQLRIAARLGISHRVIRHNWVFDRPVAEPRRLALKLNVHRRHLTPGQRRELTDALLRAEPERADWDVAADVRVDHKTVAGRRKLDSTGKSPQSSARTGRDGWVRRQRRRPPRPGTVAGRRDRCRRRVRLRFPRPTRRPADMAEIRSRVSSLSLAVEDLSRATEGVRGPRGRPPPNSATGRPWSAANWTSFATA